MHGDLRGLSLPKLCVVIASVPIVCMIISGVGIPGIIVARRLSVRIGGDPVHVVPLGFLCGIRIALRILSQSSA